MKALKKINLKGLSEKLSDSEMRRVTGGYNGGIQMDVWCITGPNPEDKEHIGIMDYCPSLMTDTVCGKLDGVLCIDV